jgi:hypothetical protein
MPRRLDVKPWAGIALAAALAAACAEPPPVITPPPPAPPSVALSPKLVELASAYSYYMARATAITPDFADGEGVARSLREGAAYEPNQLAQGAIVYAAVSALQDKTFVDGVRQYAKDRETRQQVAYELMKDPRYVLGLPGVDSAAGLVVASLGGRAQALYNEGKAVKQAAYDIQRQPWSKQDVAGRDARLAGAKAISAAPMSGDAAETARLGQAATGAPVLGLTGAPVSRPYTPTVIRGLAIAALAALGEAGDAQVDTILGLAQEPNIGGCMRASKLNLYQCLAVARPNYEDVFCLGQHAMMDTGRCLIRASGLPEPSEPRFVPSQESVDKGYTPKKKAPARKKMKKG